MVDMALAKDLFTRISGSARILLVGDADQLPSVGAGNVFRELMQSGRIPVTRLDLVYRQSGTSRIAINAKLMQEDDTRLHFGDNFLFCPCELEEQAANRVYQLYMDEIVQHGIEKVQILSPFKSRGDTCVKNLNDRLREIINPPSPTTAEMKVGTRVYRTGDRVLQTRNIDEISNGDVGFIRQIIKEEDDTCSALIEFGDRSRTYSQDEMDMIELAYAMTIHKSQGSEYNTVIIPMMESHYIMLHRNLIYTAITRAKKKVILVGEKKAIYTAIHIMAPEMIRPYREVLTSGHTTDIWIVMENWAINDVCDFDTHLFTNKESAELHMRRLINEFIHMMILHPGVMN